jgi:acetyl-CoA carboxylase carboxyl transferase subunit alpha
MEHAYYSVISPEGCAAILWKSGEEAPLAAEALRLTPSELLRLELIDAVIPEPLGAAHRDPETAAKNLESWIAKSLRELRRQRPETVLRRRYERLRKLGTAFTESPRLKATAGKKRGRRSRVSANS